MSVAHLLFCFDTTTHAGHAQATGTNCSSDLVLGFDVFGAAFGPRLLSVTAAAANMARDKIKPKAPENSAVLHS